MSKLDAKHYEDNSLFQKSIAKEVLDLYPIHGNENILGVGCGDGFITANMAELVHCGSVTGIDPSIDMIRHAEIKYPQKKYLNLNFKIGMAESEHCHDSYTLITAFNCLHWSHDLPKAFNNIYHSLNKGGRFIGVLYPLESIYWTVFVETLSKPKWNKYLDLSPVSSWVESNEIKELAINTGFDCVYVKSKDELAIYASKNKLKDYIKGWLPCLLPISDSKQNEFLTDVLELAEIKFKEETSISIPYTKLTFCLVKS